MERFYAIHNTPIFLGRQGEQNVRDVAFDISHWLELYGEGAVQLYARRPGDEDMYPVPLTREGNCVIWTVAQADVAKVGQTGECELSFQPGEDALAKSEIWTTFVLPAMDGEVTDTPDAARSWIDALRRETAAQQKIAAEAAKSAQASAQSAGVAGTRAAAAAKSAAAAEEAKKAVTDMRVTAETLEPGEETTVSSDLVDGQYSLRLGLPRGERGAQGEIGPAGADGVSPTISIEEITGGHRVIITDAEGASSFDVMDGAEGSGSVAPYVVELTEDNITGFPLEGWFGLHFDELSDEDKNDLQYLCDLWPRSGCLFECSADYDGVLEALRAGRTVVIRADHVVPENFMYEAYPASVVAGFMLTRCGLLVMSPRDCVWFPNGSYHNADTDPWTDTWG